MPHPFELTITGIAGSRNGVSFSPLKVPLKNLTEDFQAGWTSPIAPKVASGSADVAVNLEQWTMVEPGSLEAGAFERVFKPGGRHYYMPSPSGTSDTWTDNAVYPLAWTVAPEEPIMCGAAHKDESGNYAFKQIVEWLGNQYAIDVKNNLVWKLDSGTWKHYIGSGTGWTTALFNGSVTSASNTTPIRITTSANHGLASGDRVQIRGVTGNDPANSIDDTSLPPAWYITVISATTFDIYSDAARTVGVAGTGAGTGGTWKATAEALNGDYPTEIFATTKTLYVGSATETAGVTVRAARKTTDGLTYTPFVSNSGAVEDAAHFALVGTQDTGYVLWYSPTGTTDKHKIIELRSGGRAYNIGSDNYGVENMAWFANGVAVTKRDGLYWLNPSTRVCQTIMDSETRDVLNGRTLVYHDERLWFNMDGHFYSWKVGKPQRETFSKFEGTKKRPFYYGKVIGAHSDGLQLYAWLKVTTTDATPRYMYWLCIMTGPKEWHPVLLVTTTTAALTGLPSGAPEPAALLFEQDRLRYSIANDTNNTGRAKSGSLHTDGIYPMEGPNEYYTRNVAIRLGIFDMNKPALKKFLKELRYSFVDRATGGSVRFYYRKLVDTNPVWTTIGDTGATGSEDNGAITFPTESGSQLGVTVPNFIELKIELRHSNASPEDAWYLTNLYLLGLAHYDPVYTGRFTAWLPRSLDEAFSPNAGGYDGAHIAAALQAGIAQAAPVTLKNPITEESFSVKLYGVPNGDRYTVVTHDVEAADAPTKDKSHERRLTVEFRQMI